MSRDDKNIFQLGNEANEYSLNFARRPGIHEAAGQGERRAVASSASTNYAALTRLNATQPPKQRQREAKKKESIHSFLSKPTVGPVIARNLEEATSAILPRTGSRCGTRSWQS